MSQGNPYQSPLTKSSAQAGGLTTVQWLICLVAVIGFAFDIYELLMLPLILKPAIASLSGPLVENLIAEGTDKAEAAALWAPGGANYVQWARILFFVPALFGGVFGLLGGYLTDRLGRRRVLTWSILLYGFSACAAGFATSLPMLLLFRCLVFVGVCVEFVAAVAWLAELFPEPVRREKVLGFTQAFSSLGGTMVALANLACVYLAKESLLPAIYGGHEAWRYTLISGLVPAIPLMILRPFLPESPAWQAKKAAGTLKRPSLAALFAPQYFRTTLVTTILFACSYGVAFGAIQHLPQIVPGLADVKTAAKEARSEAQAAAKAEGESLTEKQLLRVGKTTEEEYAATVQTFQETGGLVGRVLLAIVAVWIVSRKAVFRVFQLPGMVFVPLYFWWLSSNMDAENSLSMVKWGAALAGLFTVAQFSFWGNYLPRVYPVHLRGTGESFAANIGGRVLGTSMAWITITLSASKPPNPGKMALVAAGVAGTVALLGAVVTFFLPEPGAEDAEGEGAGH